MRVLKTGGFSEERLRHAVDTVSDALYDGNVTIRDVTVDRGKVVRFTLRAIVSGDGKRGGESAPGARRSWSGMRTVSACWHAHRDVLRTLFREFPRATIVTAMARYDGLVGFETTYPYTAYINVGSIMNPAASPELCGCGW